MRKFNKTLSVLLAVLMLCAMVPLGAMVSAEDAIIDYDFTDGKEKFSSDCYIDVIECDVPLINNRSNVLRWETKWADWANIYTYVNLEPNTDYQVTFKVMANCDSSLFIKFLTSDWVSTVSSDTASIRTSWTDVNVTLNSGAGGTVVFIEERDRKWYYRRWYFLLFFCEIFGGYKDGK